MADTAKDDAAKRWNASAKRLGVGVKLRAHDGHLALFEHFPIRRTWHNGEWWYSIIDCMGPLTGSAHPSRYWGDLKKRLATEEGLQVYDLGVNLMKLPDVRGRMQPTDCANAEILLRLIQSVRSPNAEPFKQWLARVGAMVMDVGEERAMRAHNRAQLDQSDRDLHELVEFQGYITPEEHAALTDANYGGLYDVARELDLLRYRRALPGSLPETMGSLELAANTFQRELAADMLRQRAITQFTDAATTAREAGAEIRETIKRVGGTLPEDMPQYPPLPPGEWMPSDHPHRIRWDAPDDAVVEADVPIIRVDAPAEH
ncbi:MAG: hypothetical protein H0X24_17940 [Ktedonobacterales bacterium]|nr:hypothetical protein [Ktedonobacterales bacterium]